MLAPTDNKSFFCDGARVVCIAILLLVAGPGFYEAHAQRAPTMTKPATAKKAEPSAPRKITRVPPRVRTSGSPTDSYQFLLLGDRFLASGKWNAAEAAYRESLRLGGSEAAAALKELNEQTRVK